MSSPENIIDPAALRATDVMPSMEFRQTDSANEPLDPWRGADDDSLDGAGSGSAPAGAVPRPPPRTRSAS